jgi:hypothetical protein
MHLQNQDEALTAPQSALPCTLTSHFPILNHTRSIVGRVSAVEEVHRVFRGRWIKILVINEMISAIIEI